MIIVISGGGHNFGISLATNPIDTAHTRIISSLVIVYMSVKHRLLHYGLCTNHNRQLKRRILSVDSRDEFCLLNQIQETNFVSIRNGIIIIIIYHDFLSTPRRGSHVKSGKTDPQSSRYTP